MEESRRRQEMKAEADRVHQSGWTQLDVEGRTVRDELDEFMDSVGQSPGEELALSVVPEDSAASGACLYEDGQLKHRWLYFGRTLLGDGESGPVALEAGQFLYAVVDHSAQGHPLLSFAVGDQLPESDLDRTYRALWYMDRDGNLIDMRCAPQIPAYL